MNFDGLHDTTLKQIIGISRRLKLNCATVLRCQQQTQREPRLLRVR